jgi:hypothetical protein
MIWNGTTNDVFPVRSAYHRGEELQALSKGGCSRVGDETKVWKVLWSLKFQNAVKLFMWRACNKPTKVDLFQRGVVDDKLCPLCGVEWMMNLSSIFDGAVQQRKMCGDEDQ